MFKSKKLISILLVISMLAGIGLFNVSSITAFAEENKPINELEKKVTYYTVDNSDPHNPIYYDADGNRIDIGKLVSGDEENAPVLENLPLSYNSRNDGLVTSVKNQSPHYTCWSFAAVAALESDAVKKGYMTVDEADFSESYLDWFTAWPIDSINETSANDGEFNINAITVGANQYDAVATLSRQGGIALESDYSYDGLANATNDDLPLYKDSERYNTGSGLYVDNMVQFPSKDNSAGVDILSEVKAWIMNHGGAVISYAHSFENKYYNEATSSYYYPAENEWTGGHDVEIVGWDDTYPRDNFNEECRPQNNGAWYIKNSWGKTYGEDGYFWMSYESLHSFFYGYEAEKSEEKALQPYTYNGVSAIDFYTTVYSPSIITANVFKANGNEALSKVAFYTLQRDLDVDVRVYKLEDKFTAPISGDLMYTASESYHNIGYHTLNLKNKVELSEGQLFSVVVEYKTKGDEILIPIENNNDGNGTPIKSSKGESWFGYNGYWIDTGDLDEFSFGNCYINAITVASSGAPDSDSDSAGKISVLPSEIVINEGEVKGVNVAFSPWKAGNFKINTWSDEEIVSCEYDEPLSGVSSSKFYNGVARLNVEGIKAGTTEIKLDLIDSETDKVVDTAVIKVTVNGPEENGNIFSRLLAKIVSFFRRIIERLIPIC